MGYQSLAPSSLLKKYIVHFWEGEIKTPENQVYKYIATASSCPQLLFYIKGRFSGAPAHHSSGDLSCFFGQTTRYADYLSSGNAAIFGIQFYPYAIPYLFSTPSEELTDERADLRALLGIAGQHLEEQLMNAVTFDERAMIITRFFESRIREIEDRDKRMVSVIHNINKVGGVLKTESLAREVHLSERQFERKFKALTGFSPKSYARIVRFEHALQHFIDHPKPLTDLALISGYYDQAHFNHDFKHFTGYSPKAYYESLRAMEI